MEIRLAAQVSFERWKESYQMGVEIMPIANTMYQPKIWDKATSSWIDNPDYVQVERETTVGNNTLKIQNNSLHRRWEVKGTYTQSDGTSIASYHYNASSPDDAIDNYNTKLQELLDAQAIIEAEQDADDAEQEDRDNFETSTLEETIIEGYILPEDMLAILPVSDFDMVNVNLADERTRYTNSFGTEGNGYFKITQLQVNYNGQTQVLVKAFDDRIIYGQIYNHGSRVESDADYLEQVIIAQNRHDDLATSWVSNFQDSINAEELRLGETVTTTTEIVESEVVIEKTTKEIKIDMIGVSEFEIDGDYEWKFDGQILYLEDDDLDGYTGAKSASVKIVFENGYNFDVRIGLESEELTDQLIKLGWAEKDDDTLDLATSSSGMHTALDTDSDATFLPETYLNGVLTTQMTKGGYIELDIDKTAGNGIAGFKIFNAKTGRTFQLTNWKIDDEVMVNISNPTQTVRTQTTTTTNALGEIVSVVDEVLDPDPFIVPETDPIIVPVTNECETGYTWDATSEMCVLDDSEPKSNIGWWILGGCVVIGLGLILWKMSNRTSQNRLQSSPVLSSTPTAAPVVVNVESGN